MLRKERQPLKSFTVRHQITVKSTKFIKHARSILCKLGNTFYTDLNKPRPGLIKVEGKTALLSISPCWRNVAFFIPLAEYLKYTRSKDVRKC